MIHKSGTYISHDGLKIYSQVWKPVEKPKKVICLVHGIGEHSGRYAAWAEKFIAAGYAFFSFDLRGHGKSEGKKGDATSYELFMKDIEQALQETVNQFPDIPVILYGHSLGGNFVLNYLLRKQPEITGAIVTSPWLELALKVPFFKETLGKVVRKIIPGLIQPNGLHFEDLSRNVSITEMYKNDPLVHNKISVRLYFAACNSGAWVMENTDKLKTPLLLMHGDKDRITSYKASALFAEKTKQKTFLKIWEGCYHELHNEPENEEIERVVLKWLEKII